MKTNVCPIAGVAILLLLSCVGCAQTEMVCIRVVDHAPQPIGNVEIRWREDSAYNLLTGTQHRDGPIMLIPDHDGTVKVKVHTKWQSRFTFSRAGQPVLYGMWSHRPETLSVGTGILASSESSEAFLIAESSRTEVKPTNGCFIVDFPK